MKILISCPQDINYGGVQNYVYNIINNMDTSKKSISICFAGKIVSKELYNKFLQLGITVFVFDSHSKKELKNMLRKIISENTYDVIHINTGDIYYQYINLKISKQYKIAKRIVHSHNAMKKQDKNFKFLHYLKNSYEKFFIRKYATHYFACSQKAGISMFGNKLFTAKGIVQNNGFSFDSFKYNTTIRNQLRNELSIHNSEYVIGLVASFNDQKNQKYLIKIFKDFSMLDTNSRLVLIGDGPFLNDCKHLISTLELQNKTIIIPPSSKISFYYNIFDCFVMTSFFEGLPFVAIEAQLNGLPCLLSDSITKEVDFSSNVVYKNISENPIIWAKEILKIKETYNINREKTFENVSDCLTKANYNVKECSKKILNSYLEHI